MNTTKDQALLCVIKKGIENREIYPGFISAINVSVSEIVNETKKSRSGVNKAFAELQENGIIDYTKEEKKKTKNIEIVSPLFLGYHNPHKLTYDFLIEKNLKSALEVLPIREIEDHIKTLRMPENVIESLRIAAFCAKSGMANFDSIEVGDVIFPTILILDFEKEKLDSLNLQFPGVFCFKGKEDDSEENLLIPQQICRNPKLIYVLREYINPNSKDNYLYTYNSSGNMVNLANIQQICRIGSQESGESLEKIDRSVENGENDMVNTQKFVAKSKKAFKDKDQRPKTRNLEGMDVEDSPDKKKKDNWESLGLKKQKKNWEEYPLAAYTSNQWFDFIKTSYEQVREKSYTGNRRAEQTKLTNKIFPFVFGNLEWSARDFREFVLEKISSTKKDGEYEQFIISYFGKDNEARNAELINFTTQRRVLREKDVFERIIYLPHYHVGSEKDPVYDAIKLQENNPLAILYSYGIVNYARFIQLDKNAEYPQGMSKKESAMKIGYVLKKFIVKNLPSNPSVVEKVLTGIAQATIMWEPYAKKDSKKLNLVLDWRKAYMELWTKKADSTSPYSWDITANHWWTDSPDFSKEELPCLGVLFSTTRK